jgi:hypothetical protein
LDDNHHLNPMRNCLTRVFFFFLLKFQVSFSSSWFDDSCFPCFLIRYIISFPFHLSYFIIFIRKFLNSFSRIRFIFVFFISLCYFYFLLLWAIPNKIISCGEMFFQFS